ncbi:MAG: aldo/keto reductase, partial [Actinomycetes bacterium]
LGLSETRIGRFLADHPRRQAVISTKVGRRLVDDEGAVDGVDGFYGAPRKRRVRDYSRDGVLRSVEDSCTRLGVDSVDILLIHDPDDHWPEAVGEAYPALAELRAAGAVGAIGVGMNQAAMLERFVAETDIDVVLVAGRYTLLDHRAARLLAACAQRGVAVLAGGVFNSGVLADPRGAARFDYAVAGPAMVSAVGRIERRCRQHGTSLVPAALQYPLRHPAVRAVVVGARTPAEVRADCVGLGRTVPDGLWDDLVADGLITDPAAPAR